LPASVVRWSETLTRKENTMRDLNYQLKQLCQQCREGAYNTQANREHILTLVANELHALGYRGMTARSLKPKHIEALIKDWFAKGIAVGTIPLCQDSCRL